MHHGAMTTPMGSLPSRVHLVYRSTVPRSDLTRRNEESLAAMASGHEYLGFGLGMGGAFAGIAAVICLTLGAPLAVTVGVPLAIWASIFAASRWEAQQFVQGTMLAPQAAFEQRLKVRIQLTNIALPKSRRARQRISPELQAISQEALRLGHLYDETLAQWTKTVWTQESSPDTLPFQDAADALATAIGEHVEAYAERIAWEEARRLELDAPLVQDAKDRASALLAEARASSERLSQEREQTQLQSAILASLQKGEVPSVEALRH